jgi:hypothetical protein
MKLSRLPLVPAVAGALILSFGAASAQAAPLPQQRCANDGGISFNACLTVTSTSTLNEYEVTAGQDAIMSPRYAQEIIDHGGQFRATLWGDDGSRRTWLADLELKPGWPAAGPDGLGVELVRRLPVTVLNEDPGSGDEDELYAEITYFDYHVGLNVTHRTGTVRHSFVAGSDGGDSCVVVCP